MAIDYAKVLINMQIPIIVVGRGLNSAQNFEKMTNLPVITGGLNNWLSISKEFPLYAIVAVGIDELCNTTYALLKKGFKNILLEKPGGLNYNEIKFLSKKARKFNSRVLIAYNRRFYSSVIEAKKLIKEDGGIKSYFFEFTEWSHIIENLDKRPEIKKNWLLANSSHVIDLAFYLGGPPKVISCYKEGKLEWHPDGCVFTGAGISEGGSLFSYIANWDAPGRWSVEVMTQNNRLIFKPLEKLKIQKKASVEINEVKLDDEIDTKFKPGLYRQVKAFLNNDYLEFLDIHQQVSCLNFYKKILNG